MSSDWFFQRRRRLHDVKDFSGPCRSLVGGGYRPQATGHWLVLIQKRFTLNEWIDRQWIIKLCVDKRHLACLDDISSHLAAMSNAILTYAIFHRINWWLSPHLTTDGFRCHSVFRYCNTVWILKYNKQEKPKPTYLHNTCTHVCTDCIRCNKFGSSVQKR